MGESCPKTSGKSPLPLRRTASSTLFPFLPFSLLPFVLLPRNSSFLPGRTRAIDCLVEQIGLDWWSLAVIVEIDCSCHPSTSETSSLQIWDSQLFFFLNSSSWTLNVHLLHVSTPYITVPAGELQRELLLLTTCALSWIIPHGTESWSRSPRLWRTSAQDN